jgi:hypothetical protein
MKELLFVTFFTDFYFPLGARCQNPFFSPKVLSYVFFARCPRFDTTMIVFANHVYDPTCKLSYFATVNPNQRISEMTSVQATNTGETRTVKGPH